jgi:hypothetical protein
MAFAYKSNFLTKVWRIPFLASKDEGDVEKVRRRLNNGEESSEVIARLSIRRRI